MKNLDEVFEETLNVILIYWQGGGVCGEGPSKKPKNHQKQKHTS